MPVANSRATTSAVRVLSPAKVNLYLGVTGTRADGYHELATVFERVALADELLFAWRDEGSTPPPAASARRAEGAVRPPPAAASAGGGVTCACDSPTVPTDERNLAIRAARLLQTRYGVAHGVHITIRKRIPVAAGLGGGSSNAAAVLSTLNRWWELGLSRDALLQLGREVGADVPFFLADAPWALGVGRGDVLVALPSTVRLWHVLVIPPAVALSTAEVFRAWDALGSSAGGANVSQLARVLTGLLEGRAEEVAGATWNHLMPAAARLVPAIQQVVGVLTRSGARSVSVTGSGPTVMATLTTSADAEALAARVAQAQPAWSVMVTHTASQEGEA